MEARLGLQEEYRRGLRDIHDKPFSHGAKRSIDAVDSACVPQVRQPAPQL
jgi:hypothetical protein